MSIKKNGDNTAAAAASGNITSTGAIGSEPGSPASGDLYLPNNAPYIERYSGSLWVPWGPIYPMKRPVDADFSWVNQGGASVITTNGGIRLDAPADAGTNWRLRVKTAPATPYTVTAYIEPLVGDQAAAGAFYGFGFRASGSGALALLLLYQSASGEILSIKYTNATTFSALYNPPNNVLQSALNLRNLPIKWLRIADDGVNRILYWSADGWNWVTFHTIGRTDFLTADQTCWGTMSNDAAIASSIQLVSWLEA